AMCAATDSPTGPAQVSAARDPPRWFVRRAGTTEAIPSVAPPLGLIKRAAFNETAVGLEPGDAFLLYTDGLFRWTRDERHRVTPEQLEKVLDHSRPSADAFLKHIVAQTSPKNYAKSAT